jgi:dihydroorotase
MYDLIVKGGRVIDPAQNIDAVMDVAVAGGKIAKVAANIPSSEASKVVDAAGKLVTPGLIDLHTHVYDGVLDIGANPDDAGVNQGVTTVVDCGSAGYATFGGFPKYVIPAARTTIYCLLHIGSFGISAMPELCHPDEINVANTEATISAYPGLIRGVKLRLVGKLVASQGVEIVKLAKKTAKKFNLPLMVHIGDVNKWVSPTLTKEFLPLMEEGDILSHIYTGQLGGVLGEDGKVIPEYTQAGKRGVVMDVAHGRSNFTYAVARKMIAQGYLPTTLSTDVTEPSITGPVYGLTVTMSKFLALGIPLEKIIPMVTINPAGAVRIADRKGSLKPGTDADISVLGVKSGKWRLLDCNQAILDVEKLITPFMTVKAGELIPPKPVALPEQLD